MLIWLILIAYLAGAVFTARKLVYETMLRNEGRDYFGTELEAHVYSRKEYRELAEQKFIKSWLVADIARTEYWDHPSDYTGIFWRAGAFPLYWGRKGFRAMLFKGHKKTPRQLEQENAEMRKRIKELENDLDI